MNDLESLVDWERGLISPRIFSDQDIYDLEMRKVFGRSWLFLAHESQFVRPGDFFTTFMGADPVVVVKDRDGQIRAFLNACRHRGMKVCRADMGNTKAFTCTYHGWSYDTSGRLVGVPNFEDAYYGEFEMEKWGLVEVAKVESYKGLIFGCFDSSASALVDYLGDMTFYLDAFVDRVDGGTEVIGGVHKITYRGNWKLAAEQFAGDNYHFETHVSAFMSWMDESPAAFEETAAYMANAGLQVSTRNGHGVSGFSRERSMDPTLRDMVGQEVVDYYQRTGPEAARRLGPNRTMMVSAGTVFPSFSYLAGAASLGVWHPKGPDSFEGWRWCLVDKSAPADVRQAVQRGHQFWPLGVADSDDGENWGQIGRNMTGPQVNSLELNYQMGLGHERTGDPDYPGTVNDRVLGELPQRRFYRRWLEMMTSDTWPHVSTDHATPVSIK